MSDWITLLCCFTALRKQKSCFLCMSLKIKCFFSFTITGRGVEIEKSVYPNMEKKTICIHLFKSYISVTRSSYQPACGFPSTSHSQAPPCLCRCYSLTWHCLFSLCALCVLSLSWRLHSCILTSVKPSLPPFNKYPAALLFLDFHRLLH